MGIWDVDLKYQEHPTHPPTASLPYVLIHSLTHSLTHSLARSLTLSLILTLILLPLILTLILHTLFPHSSCTHLSQSTYVHIHSHASWGLASWTCGWAVVQSSGQARKLARKICFAYCTFSIKQACEYLSCNRRKFKPLSVAS